MSVDELSQNEDMSHKTFMKWRSINNDLDTIRWANYKKDKTENDLCNVHGNHITEVRRNVAQLYGNLLDFETIIADSQKDLFLKGFNGVRW